MFVATMMNKAVVHKFECVLDSNMVMIANISFIRKLQTTCFLSGFVLYCIVLYCIVPTMTMVSRAVLSHFNILHFNGSTSPQ